MDATYGVVLEPASACYLDVPHVNICKCLKEEAERIRENMIDTTPDCIIDLYMTSCGEYVINNDNDYLFQKDIKFHS